AAISFVPPRATTLGQESRPILPVAPGTLHRRRTADVVKRSLLDDGEDRGTLSRPGMTPLDTEGSQSRAFVAVGTRTVRCLSEPRGVVRGFVRPSMDLGGPVAAASRANF